MANPQIVRLSLNKTSAAPGDDLVLTVEVADADNRVDTITVTGQDQTGNPAVATIEVTIVDNVAVSVSDSSGRTWTRTSTTGNVSTFTAKA